MESIQHYLKKVLNCDVQLTERAVGDFPHFVRRMFKFYSGLLFGTEFYLAVADDDFFDTHSFDDIESTRFNFKRVLGVENPVFAFDTLSRRHRSLLVKHRIPFIVPDVQMFLPPLGIDFSEYIKEDKAPLLTFLPPAAQAIIIEQLVSDAISGMALSKIAEKMNYAIPSVMRAAEQLRKHKLCIVKTKGKSKILIFQQNRKTLWEQAYPFLKTPVKKVLHVSDATPFETCPYSGEYALSKYSSLSGQRKCYAILDSDYYQLKKNGQIQLSDSVRNSAAEVEIWSYRVPSTTGDTVDTFSLELEFKDNPDARIKLSIMEMQEARQW